MRKPDFVYYVLEPLVNKLIDLIEHVMTKPPKKRCPIARDLHTPKYRKRVVPDKKKKADKEMCRNGKKET